MKKSFLIAAMAGLAFVGCTESDLDSSVKSQQAISFSAPAVRPNTKAAEEIGVTYDKGLQFNVFGNWFTGDYTKFGESKTYINEATAVYDATGNTWYPLNGGKYYYWPKNGTITFSAYSPASDKMKDAANITANGLTFTDYVVSNTNNSAMEDVLFSERAYNKVASTGSNNHYAGVDIQFRHALSSIVFTAKMDKAYPGTQVRIKTITLSNVASKASFNQYLDDDDAKKTKLPTIAAGTGTSTNEAAWKDHSTYVAYSVDNSEKILENKDDAAPWYFCTTDGTAPAYYGAANNYRKSDFILIPQNLDGVTLTIKYTIKTPDSEEIDQTFTKVFTSTAEWKMGYRYIYNIAIGFNPITLAPMVTLYEDVTDINVAI